MLKNSNFKTFTTTIKSLSYNFIFIIDIVDDQTGFPDQDMLQAHKNLINIFLNNILYTCINIKIEHVTTLFNKGIYVLCY